MIGVNEEPNEAGDDATPVWSFHRLWELSDRTDQILLRVQTASIHGWMELVKSMESLDQLVDLGTIPMWVLDATDAARPLHTW